MPLEAQNFPGGHVSGVPVPSGHVAPSGHIPASMHSFRKNKLCDPSAGASTVPHLRQHQQLPEGVSFACHPKTSYSLKAKPGGDDHWMPTRGRTMSCSPRSPRIPRYLNTIARRQPFRAADPASQDNFRIPVQVPRHRIRILRVIAAVILGAISSSLVASGTRLLLDGSAHALHEGQNEAR